MVRGVVLVVVALVVGLLLIGQGLDPDRRSFASNPGDLGSENTPDDVDAADDGTGETDTTDSTVPDTVPPRSPSEVPVLVANGEGSEGIATELSNQLTNEHGYPTLEPVRAASTPQTSVFYAEGFEADAAAIAAIIGFPNAPQQPFGPGTAGIDTTGASIVVVQGADYLIDG